MSAPPGHTTAVVCLFSWHEICMLTDVAATMGYAMKTEPYKLAADLQPPAMRYLSPLIYIVYSLCVIVMMAAAIYAVMLIFE